MVYHLPETEDYLQKLLERIDSPKQPKGEFHLGTILRELDRWESSYFNRIPQTDNFETSLDAAINKTICHSLSDNLSFGQYITPEALSPLGLELNEALEQYCSSFLNAVTAESEDELFENLKAIRPLKRILPEHLTKALETVVEIYFKAGGEGLGSLCTYFYPGTRGYAIEFSIFPEDIAIPDEGVEKQTEDRIIKLTRTDFITVIYSYEEKKNTFFLPSGVSQRLY